MISDDLELFKVKGKSRIPPPPDHDCYPPSHPPVPPGGDLVAILKKHRESGGSEFSLKQMCKKDLRFVGTLYGSTHVISLSDSYLSSHPSLATPTDMSPSVASASSASSAPLLPPGPTDQSSHKSVTHLAERAALQLKLIDALRSSGRDSKYRPFSLAGEKA